MLPRLLKAALAGQDVSEASLHIRRLKSVAAAIDGEIESVRADTLAGVIPPRFVLGRLRDSIAATLSLAPASSLYVTALRDRLIALKQIQSDPSLSVAPLDSRAGDKLLSEAETVVGNGIFPAYRRAYAAYGDLQLRASDDASIARLPSGKDYYNTCLALHVGRNAPRRRSAPPRCRACQNTQRSARHDAAVASLADGDTAQRLAMLAADARFMFAETPESGQQMLAEIRHELSRMAPLLSRVLRKTACRIAGRYREFV